MPLEFQQVQQRFAAHIRNPALNPAPADIEPRRMKIYADLFYNNVEGFLASGFPVLRKLTPDTRWHAMARDFFSRHQSHTPLFHRIAEEFLKYLDEERGEVAGDPAFLRELAHYEWVELALSVAEDKLTPEHADPNGNLMSGVPVASPLAWTLAYEFPVHRLAPDFQPTAPAGAPTFLIVYRTLSDEVKFMEINAVTARLMELIAESPDAGRALLERVAAELKHPQPQAVVSEGEKILNDLHQRGIILGTKR
ncbi:MAG: putative DNA-binding domain-containing protein [Pseudomonadota bacterium]